MVLKCKRATQTGEFALVFVNKKLVIKPMCVFSGGSD